MNLSPIVVYERVSMSVWVSSCNPAWLGECVLGEAEISSKLWGKTQSSEARYNGGNSADPHMAVRLSQPAAMCSPNAQS